jgi:hypothetical protein
MSTLANMLGMAGVLVCTYAAWARRWEMLAVVFIASTAGVLWLKSMA